MPNIWFHRAVPPLRGSVGRIGFAAALALLVGVETAGAADVAPAGKPPAGWRVLKDKKSLCQMIVPSAWKGEASTAYPEDHSAMAAIHALAGKDWTDSKTMALEMMKPTAVMEDSVSRYWFAYGDPAGGHLWYVSVPGATPCAGQITFKDAAFEDTAKQIALSLATVSP